MAIEGMPNRKLYKSNGGGDEAAHRFGGADPDGRFATWPKTVWSPR